MSASAKDKRRARDERIVAMRRSGESINAIARGVGMTPQSVGEVLIAAGLRTRAAVDNTARNAQIVAGHAMGEKPPAIARRLGISVYAVHGVLKAERDRAEDAEAALALARMRTDD